MLDAMRRSVANIFTKALLGLLIIAFAIWGIGDYVVRSPWRSNALATVGKTEITVDKFRQAYKDEMQSIARRLGRTLTPEQAQILGIPPRALARLVGNAALDLHANALSITISDGVVANIIKADPRFSGPGGFSRTQFRQVIGEAGYRSEEEYIQAARRDLMREQLTETLGAGIEPQQFLIEAQHRFRDEARVIEHITPDFAKLVTIPEPQQDQLQEFFEQNKRQYIALEERKANLLLLTREAAMSRVNVSDEEVKAAYDAAKDAYDVPEKRRVLQLTFPDKAAAEKAYGELSKAKDFDAAAAKLGFSAGDMQLGEALLTKAEMIDPKIADAAFKLKKNELSQPVEGQYSVVLLRVPEIEAGKQRTFEGVKGEVRERIATERVGQQLQSLHDKVEAGRAKGTPLKEIAQELKLPFQEIAGINRTGKSNDGKTSIASPDAGRIAEAIFVATPGVETEIIELSDSGYAWFDLLGITPERQRAFDEVAADVRASFVETERRKEIASRVSNEIVGLKAGEGLDKIAKAFGRKVERTGPIKRGATPPPAGLTAVLVQQAFALPKGGVASLPTPDGKSRTIFRVADVIAAPPASANETAALKADLAKQMRVDLLDQYVGALRTRYGFTVNEKLLVEALGTQSGQPAQPDQEATN